MFTQIKDSDISEIILKFDTEETLLNDLLKNKDQDETKSEDSKENSHSLNITIDEAIKRNTNLLKEFELVKARLRSKAIFCPTEIQWDDICRRYQQAPSLSVTTWRCHLPVFV